MLDNSKQHLGPGDWHVVCMWCDREKPREEVGKCCGALYPIPKSMGPELKVKGRNTTVLKHRLLGAGQYLGGISPASERRARAGG